MRYVVVFSDGEVIKAVLGTIGELFVEFLCLVVYVIVQGILLPCSGVCYLAKAS